MKVVPGKHRCGVPEPPAATEDARAEDQPDLTQSEREILEGADGEGDSINEGKEAHDEEAVSGVRARAIDFFKREFGLEMTAEDEKIALGIFPKAGNSFIHVDLG